MINLISHFKQDENSYSESLRQRKWFIKAREDKVRREEVEEKHEENISSFAIGIIVATELEIKTFEAKLDKYDAATVTALMENQKQLDAVNTEIEILLNRAYVMEDGRRVFKTEDGSQVFDEFGQEISSDELDYDLISSKHPTWETMQQKLESRNDLLAEKEDIHAYQEKLDEAREKISEGDISAAELEELDAELLEMMPEAVQAHVPGMEKTATAPDLSNPSKSSEPETMKVDQPSGNPVIPSTLQF